MNKKTQKQKRIFLIFALCICTLIFLKIAYLYDNKYTTPPPFAQDGTLFLNEFDLHRDKPIFLIDGWEYYPCALSPNDLETKQNLPPKTITYIGEFSNYQRGDWTKSPLGSATYRLQIEYQGRSQIVSIDFPELFDEYTLWLNGSILDQGFGTAHVSFLLHSGQNQLVLNITSDKGYYSGMYFPAALGTEKTVQNAINIKTALYSFALFCPLTLALFSLTLWRQKRHSLHRYFGLFCLCFCCYISYYFVQLYALPLSPYWYMVEDCAFYGLCYYALMLSVHAAGVQNKRFAKLLLGTSLAFPAAGLVLYFLIPYVNFSVVLHGQLQNIYRVFVVCCLGVSSLQTARSKNPLQTMTLAANLVFGIGILSNLLNSNLYEPIFGFWQFEWCALLVLLVFAYLMICQNKQILTENALYASHLEDLVQQRTHQLSCVLEERRQFFYEMAHDLKAPLSATKNYVDLIKMRSTAQDQELQYFIDQVERKQGEMSKRVQSLNALGTIDKITTPSQKIWMGEFLKELFCTYEPDAKVREIYFYTTPPTPDCCVFMQREKLDTALENLIYNAMVATPQNGSITVSAKCQQGFVQLQISDTGRGIPPQELPLIFNRFFVGDANKSVGSGLGLYIVKTVVEEAGGQIWVESTVGKGSVFTIVLPLGI